MSLIRSFTKDTIYYGIGYSVKKLIGFFLLPIYTRILSPADYGILDSLGAGVLILSLFLGMKITEAGSRYYFVVEDEHEKKTILFTVFLANILTIIPSSFIAFFSKGISIILFKTDQYTWVVFAASISIPFVLLNDEQSWIYRYKRTPWRFNIYVLFRALLNVGIGILFVVYLKKGVLGAQLATIISLITTISFSFFTFTRMQYSFKFSFKWYKKMIKFSYPLMLSGLVAWIYTSADRYILLGYKNTTDVGLFSIGRTFAQPISLLNMAIGMSFYPFFMSLYEKENNNDKTQTKKVSTQIWYLYLFIALNICLILSVFGTNLIKIITTPVYYTAASVIPILIFSSIFRQSIDITSLGMFLKEKTIHYTWLVALTSAISLGLNFLFIPRFSFQGAAMSNMLSNLVYLFVAYNLSQKYFYVKRKIGKVFIYLFIVFVVSFFIPFLEINYNQNIRIFYKLILISIIFWVPFLLNIIDLKILTIHNRKI